MEPLAAADPRGVGEFRLLARLGSGGMGQVFLALSPAGRMVAVKIIHSELARDLRFVSRFRGEVAAARMVSGLYTAPLVAAGVDESPLWLATAFVPGPSLDDIVSRRGPLPVPALWRLAAGLAEALRAIHAAGLVHRDLKPENVLLALDGPRVIDFGISRALADTRLTTTGMVVGTPAYMSPEQVDGQAAGPPSDVFSLGSVLAFAASGSSPFSSSGATPASMLYRVVHAAPDLAAMPAEIQQVLAGCLAKDPAQRPDLGRLAALGMAATRHLELSPADFWPPGVAEAIRRHEASAAAQIQSLQVTSPVRGTSWPDSQEDTAGFAAGAAGPGSPAAPAAPAPYPPEVPAPYPSGISAPSAPLVPPPYPPEVSAPYLPRVPAPYPPGGPAPGLSAPYPAVLPAPADAVSAAYHRDWDEPRAFPGPARNGSAEGGMQPPAAAPSRAADGRHAAGRAGGVSRRGLLIGAGVAGVAVIGGLGGWALASGSLSGAGPSANGNHPGRSAGRGGSGRSGGVKAASPAAAAGPAPSTLPQFAHLEQGQKAWSFPTNGPVDASPTAAGNLVYVASLDDHLYAVDIATGLLAWSCPVKSVSAAPTVAAGMVCAAGESDFYAIDAGSGKLAWQVQTGASAARQSWAVDGSTVSLVTNTGAIQTYNAATGRPGMSYTTSALFLGPVAVAPGGGILYAVDLAGTLHAINASSGITQWHVPLLQQGQIATSMFFADDTLYLGVAPTGKLYSFNAGTGSINWAYPAGAELLSNPVIADGVIYLINATGVLQAITATDATKLWTAQVGGGVVGPAVASGQVYAGAGLELQSRDAKTGKLAWSFALPGTTFGGPAPAFGDGLVFFGCQDNNLYAVRA